MLDHFSCLTRTELFARVVSGARDVPSGTRYAVGADDNLQIAAATIGDLNLVAFYTDRSDARLGHPCISMTGEEAMRMVMKAGAEGMAVQNNKNSYFGLTIQGIREALGAA